PESRSVPGQFGSPGASRQCRRRDGGDPSRATGRRRLPLRARDRRGDSAVPRSRDRERRGRDRRHRPFRGGARGARAVCDRGRRRARRDRRLHVRERAPPDRRDRPLRARAAVPGARARRRGRANLPALAARRARVPPDRAPDLRLQRPRDRPCGTVGLRARRRSAEGVLPRRRVAGRRPLRARSRRSRLMDAERIVHEARAAVAAGREPDWAELERRIRDEAGDAAEAERALGGLARVATVWRARAARPPEPPPRRPRERATLAAKPTITGTIDVRREVEGEAHLLVWDRDASVLEWEVRISERLDARSPYTVREERLLPGETTRLALDVDGGALRIHLLGRGRGGRLQRRAMVSGLTRANWHVRFEKRASAA